MTPALLPCCLQVLLPYTAGRALPRCRSHQSTASVCGSCPFVPSKRTPPLLHATFSVRNNKKAYASEIQLKQVR